MPSLTPEQLAQLPQNIPANGGSMPSDPLADLRDIHLPQDAISNLPLAPGWWVLALLIVITSLGALILWRRHKRNNRYRAHAQQLLTELRPGDDSAQSFVQSVNTLLKRSALAAYPDYPLAARYGRSWVDFLKQSAPTLTMSGAVEDYVLNSSYARPTQTVEDEQLQQQLLAYANEWLSKHETQRKFMKKSEGNC